MKKKTVKRMLALGLGMVMMMSVIGCQKAEDDQKVEESKTEKSEEKQEASASDDSSKEQEIVTLSAYGQDAMGTTDNAGWFVKIYEEELGIKLDHKPNVSGTDLMATYMASGELPDLVVFSNLQDMLTAAEGGMLLDLNEYKDQLPNVFETEDFDIARTYMELVAGGLYALPQDITDGTGASQSRDWVLRWDVYEDAGYPKVDTFYDYLDAIKAMLEVYPKNEEGLDMYGIGLFNDWDGDYCYPVWSTWMFGKGYSLEPSPLTYHPEDASALPKSILEDESEYYNGLKWLYTANQMGLIDPESTAMPYENFNAKASNGQYMYTWWWWWDYGDSYAEDYMGYAPVWPEEATIAVSCPYMAGQGRFFGISSACENVDAALKFFNWYNSYEVSDLLCNGPEGVLYEWKDGTRVPTQAAIDAYESGETYVFEDGGTLGEASFIFQAIPLYSNHGEKNGDGNLQASSNAGYKEIQRASRGTNYLKESWEKVYGEVPGTSPSLLELNRESGKGLMFGKAQDAFFPAASDDIAALTTQIGQIVVQNSWKMIFAENEAEFEALWEQTQADAEALGISEVVEDSIARFKAGVDTAVSYGMMEQPEW